MCGFLEIGKWQIIFQKKLDWFDLQSAVHWKLSLNFECVQYVQQISWLKTWLQSTNRMCVFDHLWVLHLKG